MARGIPRETRARILSAATRLFYAHGIRAIGVEAIAVEASVTKRTLYKHFESKNVLIAAYLESRNEPVLAALIGSLTDDDGGIETRVARLFSDIGERSASPDWHGCPFARAVSEFRTADDLGIARLAIDHKRQFEDWLTDHLAASGVARPGHVARQLVVLVDGCILHLLIHRDSAYAKAAGEAAVQLLRQGLADDPARLEGQ